MKFPERIPLPEEVPQAREERHHQLVHSSTKGVMIRSSIVAMELIGVALYGSSALLMDALSSLIDIGSSLLLILCIKLASRPPDEDHPFGHGRYEPLAGFQLGTFLVVVGIVTFFQQLFQAVTPVSEPPLNGFVWLIPALATLLLELCYQMLNRAAKKQLSPALAADAIHYRIDGLTSLFATIALMLAAFYPSWSHEIDHLGAMIISTLMVTIGVLASKNNLNQLLDRVPDPDYFDKVRKAALKVPGVKETEKIRIQLYGPDAHVDIDIEVEPTLPVEVAHEISQKVRTEIQKEWPLVRDVTVHIEPYYPGDHNNA